MSAYQVYLSENQKDIIVKYIDQQRCKKTALMFYCIVNSVWQIFSMLTSIIRKDVSFSDDFENIIYLTLFMLIFLYFLIKGFGKDFGFNSDISCIKKGNYSLSCAKFCHRQENLKNKHPYYIYDDFNNFYICPVFLDYRNATSDDNFLYIKLNNGRGYALLDK